MARKLANYIWFEKYRPLDLNSISLTKEHKETFQQYNRDGEIPHLLFAGPQGSGKTTMAYILLNSIPNVSLTLNASGEDRGIDTIKGKVKLFASSQPPAGKIKIILLDESDALTKDSQTALRNTMETYSKSCRFILTCNYVDKIIAPLQSRCIKFTFDRFPKRKLIAMCEEILQKESIDNVTQDDLYTIINRFYPDIRSVINNLQAACANGKFNLRNIGALNVDPARIMETILKGEVLSLRQHLAGVTDFVFLYRYLFDEFLMNNGTEEQKAEMVQVVAEALVHDTTAPDREIVFVSCAIGVMATLGITANFSK